MVQVKLIKQLLQVRGCVRVLELFFHDQLEIRELDEPGPVGVDLFLCQFELIWVQVNVKRPKDDSEFLDRYLVLLLEVEHMEDVLHVFENFLGDHGRFHDRLGVNRQAVFVELLAFHC